MAAADHVGHAELVHFTGHCAPCERKARLMDAFAEWRLRTVVSDRDRDWILALAQGMGQIDGLRVPIVPDPIVVKECLDAFAEWRLKELSKR